jgi:hypothetical protein
MILVPVGAINVTIKSERYVCANRTCTTGAAVIVPKVTTPMVIVTVVKSGRAVEREPEERVVTTVPPESSLRAWGEKKFVLSSFDRQWIWER